MKTKSILLLILPFLACFSAKAKNELTVIGEVYESVMNEPLTGATVKLLNAADSSFVTATLAKSGLVTQDKVYYDPKFNLTLPSRDKKYILAISFTGYEPKYIDINPASVGKKQYELNLGRLILEPAAKKLGEVSVTATKIKFYNRGDTLVYNADAFNLAEGSMLDALIRQLPDVKLTQQGEIFVAGQKVESLLLNGKGLFGDNKQIMLSNLGAYMVKNVEVYKKAGFESEVAGRDMGDKQLVMDVKLKKEYMVGILANYEAGYGTHDRYMARLFTVAIQKKTQLAIYANANNVNASQTPQPDTDWRPEAMPTGTKDVAQAGFKHWFNSPDTKWMVFTSADFTHTKEKDGTDLFRTNFLNSADTYENSFRRSRNKQTEVKNHNEVTFKNLKGYGFRFIPNFTYSHWNRDASEAMAAFSRKLEGISSSVIEDIYDGNHSNLLKYMINRDIELSRQHGHFWNAGGTMIHTISIPGTSDQMTIRVDGHYKKRKNDRFEKFDINFGENPAPAHSANRYYKDYPDFNSRIAASAKYVHYLDKHLFVQLAYEFDHRYAKNTSELFRLEMLDSPEADFFRQTPL